MRIWQRIYLAVMIVVILFIYLTGTVIITSQYKQNLQMIQRNTKIEEEYLEERIQREIQDILSEGQFIEGLTVYNKNTLFVVDDLTFSKAFANVSDQADNYGIRILSGDEYFQNAVFQKQLLHAQGYVRTHKALFYCQKIVGRVYGRDIVLWMQMDATQAQTLYWNQIRQLLVLGGAFSFIAAVILMGLVFYFLRPLKSVREGVHHIASGNYETRLSQEGKTELTELAVDVNEMAGKIQSNIQELERIAENRRMFIGNMVHEMKTPLTSILGFADVLSIKPDLTQAERLEYSEIIVREARRLQNLSGKLMELVQMQTGQIDLKPVNLQELLEEIIAIQEIVMREKVIVIQKKLCRAQIAGDRDLLQSLILNILDNSRKASMNGGVVEILMETEGEQVVLSIRDHGIGMEKCEMERVKEPFYMVDKSRSRKAGGSGLGLALCAEIVRLHYGKFQMISEPGKGCISVLSFPLEVAYEAKS